MQRRRTLGVLALAVLALGLCACAETSSEEAEPEPSAKISEVKGTELKYVTLAPHAAERLGLRMAPIGGQPGAETLPYSAVIYDGAGRAWVYVRSDSRTYRRKRIAISDITADTVTISSGPAVGTPIVTRGGAELFGAEDEIGAEEPE
jgi:hypothetical protein